LAINIRSIEKRLLDILFGEGVELKTLRGNRVSMKNNVQAVLSQAKEFLGKQSYDAAHDLSHHENVWRTAQEIVENIHFDGDIDLLHIACMWHDLLTKPYPEEVRKDHKKVTGETAEYVKNFMIKNGFSESEAQTVFLAVKYHEFDDHPRNIEGQVLFDADKLDVLSTERVRRFVQSDKAGKVPMWKVKSYTVGAEIFLKQMRRKFQLDYSKKLFDQKIKSFFEDPEIQEYAKRYNFDLKKLEQSVKKTTLLDKIVSLFS
jgi:HD superfamily phosphodiesterase